MHVHTPENLFEGSIPGAFGYILGIGTIQSHSMGILLVFYRLMAVDKLYSGVHDWLASGT